MDLILWRHADAENGAPDLARALTAKGRSQAARVAQWLHQHLPPGFEVIASPAVRAQQTAETLGGAFKTSPLLAPGAPVASFLLSGDEHDWHIDKGALWWLAGEKRAFVRAVVSPGVISPDLL
jgi:phosphohistidine phosphatase